MSSANQIALFYYSVVMEKTSCLLSRKLTGLGFPCVGLWKFDKKISDKLGSYFILLLSVNVSERIALSIDSELW